MIYYGVNLYLFKGMEAGFIPEEQLMKLEDEMQLLT